MMSRYFQGRLRRYYPNVFKGKGAYTYKKAAPARAPARAPRRAPARALARAPRQRQSAMASMGSKAGAFLGNLAGKFLGLGEYKVSRNSLVNGGSTSAQVPFMHSANDGVRIRHREFIQDITTQTAFSNSSFSVNPGLSATFPWLSALAQNFEQYRFEGLVFEYVPMCGDAVSSTNSTMGTVVMVAEYNTTQPAYINKQQMENSMWAVSNKPSNNIAAPIECAPQLNPLANQYIRTGAVASGQDIRFYDLCNLQVASVGAQSTFKCGELWATYDVVLLKPQLDSGLALSAEAAHLKLVAPAAAGPTYFGTSRSFLYDSIGLSISGNNAIVFPLGCQGTYQIIYSAYGTSSTVTAPSFLVTGGGSRLISLFNNNTLAAITSDGTTTTQFIYVLWIWISDPTTATFVTLSGGTLCTASTYGDVIVSQLNDNMRLNP